MSVFLNFSSVTKERQRIKQRATEEEREGKKERKGAKGSKRKIDIDILRERQR
jgi:7,8-dihydro-6-hydroxymethylpterin-pyrophosphokinase